MQRDPFSKYHPLVNFLYFLGAIGCVVVFQHPVYLLIGCVSGGAYSVCLEGRKGIKAIAFFLPAFLLLSILNPLFNTQGQTVLFTYWGRPYTLEALIYGAAVAGIFVGTLLWFRCYSAVLTEDKFTALFGNSIPSLSLLLVMVFRLIPNLMGKARQILDARNAIGLGAATGTSRQKLRGGLSALSALTTWSLEGSIVTADSMRSRGYGTGKRTSFQVYKLTGADYMLLGICMGLLGITLIGAFTGGTAVVFLPAFSLPALDGFHRLGAVCYGIYMLIPTILSGKEALLWHILQRRI